jgi:hypothetical protein
MTHAMPTRSANVAPPSDREWPVRGVMSGAATPVGPTAYPGGAAGRAAEDAPGNGMLDAPDGTALPRTTETTGVPKADGRPGVFAPPTEFGVLPTGAE